MLDELLGGALGVGVGSAVYKGTKKVTREVTGTRQGDDELTDIVVEGLGITAGVVTGMAVFDLFDDEE